MEEINTQATEPTPEQKLIYRASDINRMYTAYENIEEEIVMLEEAIIYINDLPEDTSFLLIKTTGERSVKGSFVIGDKPYTDEFFGDNAELRLTGYISTALLQTKIDYLKTLQETTITKLQKLMSII